ncbi:MAG: sugar ABC transporter substrate-binding protein [Bacteroidota bacterium]|nr:sugar ABC transporter substrate-binding protein [Bacteroidota bacterium]
MNRRRGFFASLTMTMNSSFLLFFFFFSTFFFSSCSHMNNGEKVITFWAMGAEGENVQKLVNEFEKLHPDIHVRVQQIPWTAAHEKLLTAFAGNSMPDIFQLGNTWIPEFHALNALEPLDTWIASSRSIKSENYFSGIWQTNIVDSAVYGIPWYVDTRVVFYRKDVLTQAGFPDGPKSWQDWQTASKRIVAIEGKNNYAILLPTNEWVPPVVMGLGCGSPLLKDNNCYGDFSGKEFMTAFEFYISFFRQHFAPVAITEVTNVYQAFETGFVSMYITGPWNIGEFSRRLSASMQSKWMTAPLPSIDGNGAGFSLAGGSSFAMYRLSNHKKEAWQLIEFLSQPSSQLEFYKLTGDLPARRETWEDSTFVNNKYIKAFRTQLEYVKPMPQVPEWEQIAMKVQSYSEAAATKKLTVKESLVELDRDVDRILDKHRWMVKHQ